jgi:flagellar basal-body rod modification protein FlgD
MTAVSLATPAATTATTAAGTAQTTLGSNYQTFLKLLMTQLQNQDPTSPLDTNQFTSQLVQYSSVEQQIATNSNLGQLIQLGQSNAMLQSAAIVGHQVTVQSSQLSLQNGQAALHYTATQAGPVAITVSDANGKVVDTASMTAAKGLNSWAWDGSNQKGGTSPDGAYSVSVTDASSSGTGAALPFTVTGLATGVTQSGGTSMLQLGTLAVPFSALSSVGK